MRLHIEGNAEAKYKPEIVSFKFNYKMSDEKKVKCMTEGIKNVKKYIDYLIDKGFKKEDVQTENFKIYRESIRKKENDKYVYVDGDYIFQYSFELTFDYNLDLISKIIDETEKMSNAPTYQIFFGLKNTKQYMEELMTAAYNDAEYKAGIFAKASGGQKMKCLEIDFDRNNYRRDFFSFNTPIDNLSEPKIKEIFSPEDITLDFSLNSIWDIE